MTQHLEPGRHHDNSPTPQPRLSATRGADAFCTSCLLTRMRPCQQKNKPKTELFVLSGPTSRQTRVARSIRDMAAGSVIIFSIFPLSLFVLWMAPILIGHPAIATSDLTNRNENARKHILQDLFSSSVFLGAWFLCFYLYSISFYSR